MYIPISSYAVVIIENGVIIDKNGQKITNVKYNLEQKKLTGISRISPGLLVLMFSSLVLFVGGSVVVVGVGVGVGGLTNSGIEHSPEVFKTYYPPR